MRREPECPTHRKSDRETASGRPSCRKGLLAVPGGVRRRGLMKTRSFWRTIVPSSARKVRQCSLQSLQIARAGLETIFLRFLETFSFLRTLKSLLSGHWELEPIRWFTADEAGGNRGNDFGKPFSEEDLGTLVAQETEQSIEQEGGRNELDTRAVVTMVHISSFPFLLTLPVDLHAPLGEELQALAFLGLVVAACRCTAEAVTREDQVDNGGVEEDLDFADIVLAVDPDEVGYVDVGTQELTKSSPWPLRKKLVSTHIVPMPTSALDPTQWLPTPPFSLAPSPIRTSLPISTPISIFLCYPQKGCR
ncbi:hypothetical protein K435DRAFT_858321 [Dendrothele bispora CBS 962.96]|uniref:Uncharacterized protein n=1 Tax=Dendrothele bispora (strain CBS 962.96) TaxID=1314807 RepID=A0A4S8M4K7_DENBC|nr:hypothetical protein K435DRAFT_858321 [Dendrothele bispora CBS 962.96]